VSTSAKGDFDERLRAKSRYFNADGTFDWLPCAVLQYDAPRNLYLIEWDHDHKHKWAGRFNLQFDGEDIAMWDQRVAAAQAMREEAEAQLRLEFFLKDANVGPLDPPEAIVQSYAFSECSDLLKCCHVLCRFVCECCR